MSSHSTCSAHSVELGCPVSGACPEPVIGSTNPTPAGGEGSEPAQASRGTSCLSNIMPAGGLLATGFAMASTVIGAGVLGLPAAFAKVGYVMGSLYLFCITAQTVYSMRVVVVVSKKTGLMSFESMASILIHPAGLYFVGVTRFVHSLGAQIAYVVTIGDLLRPVLEAIYGYDELSGQKEPFLLTSNGIRVLTLAIWIVLFLPVALPRNVNALRYVSTAGLAMIVVFCFCIIIHSAMAENRGPTRPVNTGNDAIGGLGVLIFSYMCQVNVLDCTREMINCTLPRFTLTTVVSISICGLLYLLTGLFGYLEFGTNVTGSILVKFDPIKEKQFLVSYIGVLAKICASYGLLSNSARSAAYAVIGWDPLTVALWKHLTFALSMAVASLLGGLFIPNVNMVFGFVGGVCGGLIAFIFPASFYMYSGNFTLRSVGLVNYVCTWLMLMAGVVAMVCGTAYTIYDVI